MLISKRDWAKYPFTKESAYYVKSLGLNVIKDLTNPDHVQIANRAEQRIMEAITNGIVTWRERTKYEVEILSYPTAIVLISNIGDDFLKRRYALAESKKSYNLLKNEDENKIADIATESFSWDFNIIATGSQVQHFTSSYIDFLRNAVNFHDEQWKLVNQTIVRGKVYLRKEEVARLLEEEIRINIQKTIDNSPQINLPPPLVERVDRISQIIFMRKEKYQIKEESWGIVEGAYPPCIKALHDMVRAGQNVSHLGRFTLTSFFLKTGMKIKNIVELYTSMSDFNNRLTKYQVEHIAGKRGSGTKYISPSCTTLQTHSICVNRDHLCKRVKHPFTYYLRKLRQIQMEPEKSD